MQRNTIKPANMSKPKRDIINPHTPKKSAECQKGYGRPRIVYTPRCNVCEGQGRIVALKGGYRPCPKCQEE